MATQQVDTAWTYGSLHTLQNRLSLVEHLQKQGFTPTSASAVEAANEIFTKPQGVTSALKRRIKDWSTKLR